MCSATYPLLAFSAVIISTGFVALIPVAVIRMLRPIKATTPKAW